MYYECSQEELRSYCRSCIESFELWARRLINEKMVECYGVDYVDAENGDDSNDGKTMGAAFKTANKGFETINLVDNDSGRPVRK